ncbi:hypothetical protein MKC74_11080 [[Clostridium] innocuum]|nr:hypothetical protein [[Clostridium] innocuum]
MKSGKEILAEFQLDPWMLYDTIVNSTDDYIYLVNMQEDRALISENMLQDFDLPDLIVPGLIPLWGIWFMNVTDSDLMIPLRLC